MTLNYFSKLKKFFRSKKEIVWINSYAKLQLLENFLKDSEIIGLDTEFHWRNTYLPRVSLIQLVTRKRIFLIDCISLKNLEIVKKKLEDRNNIIICHAVRSDSTVLFNSLNIKIKNIFDIQIADKLINVGNIKSYGELVKNYLGIQLKKGETNSNWLKRPLSSKQVEYACDDVDFLIDIYYKQTKILKNLGLTQDLFQASKNEPSLGNELLHVSRLKKIKNSSQEEKMLFSWREKTASLKDVPPSFIFKDKDKKILLRLISKLKTNKNFDDENLSKILKNEHLKSSFLEEFSL